MRRTRRDCSSRAAAAPSCVASGPRSTAAPWALRCTIGRTAQASLVSRRCWPPASMQRMTGTFGEDLDTYDVDLQHHARLGASHDVVWGLGYRLINDRVANSSALAFLPAHVTRQWFTGFAQDEIALASDLHLTLGTKIEHND